MIYLDYNATTPMDPRVLEAMQPFFLEEFGNAASRQHALGCRAAQAVERAREQIAAVIAADPREIVLLSGATESCNLALFGAGLSEVYARKQRRIVTVATEHPAVLDSCRELERRGFDVVVLPVDGEGRLDLDQLDRAVTPETRLVSVMHANNETGLIHPIEQIGALVRKRGVLFHTDATQSYGRLPLDVGRQNIDLLSFSAHKLYGPKGVGALYVRRKGPRVRLDPLIHGGGHEQGRRSGTANVPGIVGFGQAAELCAQEQHTEQPRIRELRDRLEDRLLAIEGAVRNGPKEPRLPNTLNLSFGRHDAQELMRQLPDLAVSTASACTTASLQPSHVLGAMRLDEARIQSSLRLSLGRFTSRQQTDRACDLLREALQV